MPKMNGYQVCRALADSPDLKDVPVVLMSAKGDQVGERFVKVMGIVDYITKPFSPEAITAVVQHTIGKYGGPGVEEEPSLVTGEDLAANDDADRAHARTAALGQLRGQISDVISARVAALFALAESAGDENAKVTTDAAAIADAVKNALDDVVLTKTIGSIDLGLFGEGMPGL